MWLKKKRKTMVKKYKLYWRLTYDEWREQELMEEGNKATDRRCKMWSEGRDGDRTGRRRKEKNDDKQNVRRR